MVCRMTFPLIQASHEHPETPTKEAEKETSLAAGAALLLAVLVEVCFMLAFCQEEAKTAEPVEPA